MAKARKLSKAIEVEKPRKPIRNIVVISDTHVGCSMGLVNPEHTKKDGGGAYKLSSLQQKLWDWWEIFWGEWVPKHTNNEPFVVVHNGDVIDGVHHGSTHQWTHNMHNQRLAAEHILEPVRDLCKGQLYIVRGTEAHVGKSGEHEEELAKNLEAIPDDEGNHARWDLWIRIGGRLVHFLHHIGTTASAAHEASAVNAELTSEYVEAARWSEEPPAMIVRSHRHRFIKVEIAAETGENVDHDKPAAEGSAFVTPAWQLKTPFAWRLAGARISTPQIGGVLIRAGDEELHIRKCIWRVGRSKEVVI